MATQEFNPKVPIAKAIELALSIVNAEQERLLALAMALRVDLEPIDPEDPAGALRPTAWRLAEILEERLSSSWLMDSLRMTLEREGTIPA